MKFRIILEERLDGTFHYFPQKRKIGFFEFWHCVDYDGDYVRRRYFAVDTIEEAQAHIETARKRYRNETVKSKTIIPA